MTEEERRRLQGAQPVTSIDRPEAQSSYSPAGGISPTSPKRDMAKEFDWGKLLKIASVIVPVIGTIATHKKGAGSWYQAPPKSLGSKLMSATQAGLSAIGTYQKTAEARREKEKEQAEIQRLQKLKEAQQVIVNSVKQQELKIDIAGEKREQEEFEAGAEQRELDDWMASEKKKYYERGELPPWEQKGMSEYEREMMGFRYWKESQDDKEGKADFTKIINTLSDVKTPMGKKEAGNITRAIQEFNQTKDYTQLLEIQNRLSNLSMGTYQERSVVTDPKTGEQKPTVKTKPSPDYAILNNALTLAIMNARAAGGQGELKQLGAGVDPAYVSQQILTAAKNNDEATLQRLIDTYGEEVVNKALGLE